MDNQNNIVSGINNNSVNSQQSSVNNVNSNINVVDNNITNFVNYDTTSAGIINNSGNISQDNNITQSQSNDIPQVLYDTTNYINDKPVEKVKKKATIKINPELKTSIILMIFLLIIMMIVPSIFDLFVK